MGEGAAGLGPGGGAFLKMGFCLVGWREFVMDDDRLLTFR